MDRPKDSLTDVELQEAFDGFVQDRAALEKSSVKVNLLARVHLGDALGESIDGLRLEGPLNRPSTPPGSRKLAFRLITGYRRAAAHPENRNLHYPNDPQECKNKLESVPYVSDVKILGRDEPGVQFSYGNLDEDPFALPTNVHGVALELMIDFDQVTTPKPASTVDAAPGNPVQKTVLSLLAS